MGHIHLAAYFQELRSVLQGFGDAADGPDVPGHILAHHTVAAGGSPHQLAVFVFQTAGKAVNLDLHHIFRLDAGFPHAAVKVPQLLVGKGIQQAFHLDGVGHLGKTPAGGTAHLLGRRVGRDQLRELCFQHFQFPGQGIVLKVLQFGGILVVIKTVVFLDHRAQFFRAFPGLFQFQKIHSPDLQVLLPVQILRIPLLRRCGAGQRSRLVYHISGPSAKAGF